MQEHHVADLSFRSTDPKLSAYATLVAQRTSPTSSRLIARQHMIMPGREVPVDQPSPEFVGTVLQVAPGADARLSYDNGAFWAPATHDDTAWLMGGELHA